MFHQLTNLSIMEICVLQVEAQVAHLPVEKL